ncbi:tRNA (adenosine(37)-N6)-threonylcarbamoyltransferase complex ATPase subunit type 1 TsaE [Gemmatimonadota bacterium]
MSDPAHTTRFLPDPAALEAAAIELAGTLEPGSVIALIGPLGAGKTTFVKAIARELGVEEDVTSPSFVRLNIYEGRCTLYHLDLYRVKDIPEFISFGLDEWLDTDGVTLIEWADRVAELMPAHSITVSLDYSDDGEGRIMTVTEGPPDS